MLKKENRLNANFAFNLTYKNRNFVSDPKMILYAGILKQDKNCPTRVGFVVSKKVHKRATKRNRIKRLMRETVRLMFKNNQTDIINGYKSLIFYAKDSILDSDFEEIQKIISQLIQKLANK